MLRSSLNICSKAVFRHQSTTFKLPSRILIPKRFENLNACVKFSTNPDEKPKFNFKFNLGNTEHIYHGILNNQIRAVKVFSLTSSICGIFLQPVMYEKSQELGGTAMMVAVCSIVGFFTFVTPLLLHLITRKYVIDIEYDNDTKTYTASTISFFLYTKRFHFKPEDVNIPDALGMFTSCYIRGTPLFFDLRHFTDAEHYAKIMGYDKPMDFKLGDIHLQESNEPKKHT